MKFLEKLKKYNQFNVSNLLILLIFKLANCKKFNNWAIIMAVPKRKTSPSKRNMRRSHDFISDKNILLDKNSGEPRLSHRIDLSTGIYNGRQILKQKTTKEK